MSEDKAKRTAGTDELERLREKVATLEAAAVEAERLKEELRIGEEKYRMAFEYTGTAMMVVEEDTTLSLGNHKLLEVTGYPQETASSGRSWTEFVVEEDLPRLMEYHVARRENPDSVPSEYEFRMKHGSGEIRDVFMNVSMIPGTKQSLISLIDITERKRMERALRESERKYRGLFENAYDIIYTVDFDGNFTTANAAAFETYGYSPDEMSKIKVTDLVDPQDLPKTLERIAEKAAGIDRKERYEVLTRAKDGRKVWTEISTRLIKDADGRPTEIQGISRDITERKRAERALRESEERFRSIFSGSPIGIAIADPGGAVIDSNSSFQQMFADRTGAEPSDLSELLELTADDRARIDEGLGLHVERSRLRPRQGGEGQTRFYDWHLTLLPAADDEAQPLTLVQVQDVTERKLAEVARLSEAQEEADKARRLVEGLRKEIVESTRFHNMVSRSPKMRDLFEILPEVAGSSATVLVLGESGTGKELIARSLHELGPRKDRPFVAINCSALPDNLLESELFGYKAGAFTDARADKPGKFALAEGGTIFLDEIGDISPAMQVKLLRVLQERVYEPLGGTEQIAADVRVVAATNRDLQKQVRAGEFREDLYYRINVLALELPPLRERRCDIPLLADHFISLFNARYRKSIATVSDQALEILLAHDYPGNIREMENIIEHAFIFCKCETIDVEHLPAELRREPTTESLEATVSSVRSFKELEKLYIKGVLAETGGNKAEAARRLGIHKTTLFRKLKQLGIRDE